MLYSINFYFHYKSHQTLLTMRLRKKTSILLLIPVMLLLTAPQYSCNRKAGCPATEAARSKTGKDGKLSSKRGKSNLFPKEMRRKKKGGGE